MGNSEFRYKRFGQYLGLVFLIPLIGFLLSTFFPIADFRGWADRIAVGDYPNIWGVAIFIMGLIMIGLILLEIRLFIGMAIFGLAYKITTTSNALIITGWDFWGRKLLNKINHGYYLGTIPYESIVSIGLDSWKPSVLKLTFSDGSYIFLPNRGLENHTKFIDQLSEKLTNTQGAEVFAKLNQPKRFKYLQSFLYALAFTPTIFLLFFIPVDNFESQVWKKEFTPWIVQGISPDSDGTVWVGTKNYRNDDIYIWHLSDTEKEHWTLPQELCNDCDAYTISHDLSGNPIIVTSEKDPTNTSEWESKMYRWDGNDWKKTPSELMFFNMRPHSRDTRIWETEDEKIFFQDFTTDKTKVIPPPAEVVANELEIEDFKINQDGSLLVRFSAKGKLDYLYRLENENWQFIQEFGLPGSILWEYCQDFNGNIWVATSGTDIYHSKIGFYDLERSQWNWFDFQSGLSAKETVFFHDIAIDKQGRIWIFGLSDEGKKGDFIEFVMASAWNDNSIDPIIIYTEKNTNMRFGGSFTITGDRIWFGQSNLYWINTSDELPSPYPEWVVRAKDFYDQNFGWYFLIFLGQIVLALIGASLEYK